MIVLGSFGFWNTFRLRSGIGVLHEIAFILINKDIISEISATGFSTSTIPISHMFFTSARLTIFIENFESAYILQNFWLLISKSSVISRYQV